MYPKHSESIEFFIKNIWKVSNCYTRFFESFVPKWHCSAMSCVAIRYFSNVFCKKFDTFRMFWTQIWYILNVLVTSMILFECLHRYSILFYRFQPESNNLRIFGGTDTMLFWMLWVCTPKYPKNMWFRLKSFQAHQIRIQNISEISYWYPKHLRRIVFLQKTFGKYVILSQTFEKVLIS